jgi:hypothetical protein
LGCTNSGIARNSLRRTLGTQNSVLRLPPMRSVAAGRWLTPMRSVAARPVTIGDA